MFRKIVTSCSVGTQGKIFGMRFAEAFDIRHTPEPVTVRNVGGLHTEAVIVQLAVEIHLTAVKPYSI